MKKYLSGLLGLMLALSLSAPVLAQDEEAGDSGDSGHAPASPIEGRPFYVSPMASYFLADGDRGVDDGYGLTFAIGKKLTYGLNLEATGFFIQADGNPPAGTANNGTLKLAGVGITAMVFPFTSFPNFYGILSVARGSGKGQPGVIRDYQTTVFDSGVGYLFPITSRILLRLEGRYHMDALNREKSGVQPKKNTAFYDGVFNAGVLIPLGTMEHTAPPVEEAPAEVVPTDSNDSDGDGVADDLDQCPGTPAGAVVDEKGCEADADGDGVPDRLDQCPDTAAGTQVGPNGCPGDSDGDGVLDADDECPRTPAGAKVLANGCALQGDCRTPRPGEQVDENGCAAVKAFVLKGVVFEFDSTRLTEDAKKILDQVAETLNGYPEIKVEISGHTDNVGSDAYNLGLSERRAIAVKDYLTDHSVDAARMTPVGYGKAQPIDTNDTEEGRATNRRVELRVIEAEGAPSVAPATAPEAAAPAAEEAAPAPAEEMPAEGQQ